MAHDREFMLLVEDHERTWGEKMYRRRPSLRQIMESNIVCFWRSRSKRDDKYTVTIHNSIDDVEDVLLRLVFSATAELPSRVLVRIYSNGVRMHVKAVRLSFDAEGV